MSKSKNGNLSRAKSVRNDEFYTRYEDIEKEIEYLENYHFKDKIVLMNCDNPEVSQFWRFFKTNFKQLKLRKIVATHYDLDNNAYKLEGFLNEYGIFTTIKTELEGNGDFRSSEVIDVLKECDLVVTNPPFSLFKEYMAQLVEYDKKFLVIGNMNAVTHKEVFPLLRDGKMWLGNTRPRQFYVPKSFNNKSVSINEDGEKVASLGNVCWFTNMGKGEKHKEIALISEYNKEAYPKYDNYDAIEVSRVKDIPCNYYGVMGVPITFLEKYNPNQFEILTIACGNSWSNYKDDLKKLGFNPEIKHKGGSGSGSAIVSGKVKYVRLLIKRKS